MAERVEITKKQERIDASTLDIKEKVVSLNRVSKTVKGGRTSRFSALVVVGDRAGDQREDEQEGEQHGEHCPQPFSFHLRLVHCYSPLQIRERSMITLPP